MNDMGKAQQIGIPAYNAEQEEKRKILDFLLASYNDGRRKNLFCIAVNLLEIGEIENILQAVKSDKEFQGLSKKEQASIIAKQLQDIAANKGIVLNSEKNKIVTDIPAATLPSVTAFPMLRLMPDKSAPV